jgi:DNA-binding FadR family transcriptional regulator
MSDTSPAQQERLYQDLARRLMDELVSGRYDVGDRLPAERELSAQFNVSRPTVREAVIALEVQGWSRCAWVRAPMSSACPARRTSRLQHFRL